MDRVVGFAADFFGAGAGTALDPGKEGGDSDDGDTPGSQIHLHVLCATPNCTTSHIHRNGHAHFSLPDGTAQYTSVHIMVPRSTVQRVA